MVSCHGWYRICLFLFLDDFYLSHLSVNWLLTAICLIRAITAVKYVVTSLSLVVAGPISTPQLCALGVI